MRTTYFTLIIVIIVLFIGQKNLIAQKNNVFDSKFKAYAELADLENQINTSLEKMNQEVKLILSSKPSALKKKAIAVMEQMSFDIRPAPKYALLIKKYGPLLLECNAMNPYMKRN